MTRTTVSGIRPDKTGTGEWIDINSHVGRLMSTLMAPLFLCQHGCTCATFASS